MALLYEKEGKIVTVTLNRPEALNALDPQLCLEFSEAMTRFRDDPDAWVAIITGAGRAFCVGADLQELIPVWADGSFKVPPLIMRGIDVWKPLIAAINGATLGGGLEVALACDLRIAAENAILGQPEVRWSLLPGWGGTQRLPRMIGRAKAAEMLLLGGNISAKEAYQIGLLNKVVPGAELMATAKEWAARICDNGPLGVQAAKEAMIKGLSMSLEDGLQLELQLFESNLNTEDTKEGLRAFAAKEKPEYKAR